MATNERGLDIVTFPAAGDLTGAKRGTLMTIDDQGRTLVNPNANGFCVGALYEPPKGSQAGEPVSVVSVRSQVFNVLSGAAVTRGSWVVSNNAGKAVAAPGGVNNMNGAAANSHIIGRAVEAATAADQEISVVGVNLWAAA